jgi:hypothetical protein
MLLLLLLVVAVVVVVVVNVSTGGVEVAGFVVGEGELGPTVAAAVPGPFPSSMFINLSISLSN